MDYKTNFLSTIESLSSLRYIDELQKELDSQKEEVKVKNLVGSLGSLTIAGLWHKEQRCYIIITFSKKKQKNGSII